MSGPVHPSGQPESTARGPGPVASGRNATTAQRPPRSRWAPACPSPSGAQVKQRTPTRTARRSVAGTGAGRPLPVSRTQAAPSTTPTTSTRSPLTTPVVSSRVPAVTGPGFSQASRSRDLENPSGQGALPCVGDLARKFLGEPLRAGSAQGRHSHPAPVRAGHGLVAGVGAEVPRVQPQAVSSCAQAEGGVDDHAGGPPGKVRDGPARDLAQHASGVHEGRGTPRQVGPRARADPPRPPDQLAGRVVPGSRQAGAG